MVDTEAKPLQAQFDVGNYETETEEGSGFEPGVRYTFRIDKEPVGKYMQYGKTPNPITIEGQTFTPSGLYVLSKKIPKDLAKSYYAHPDQFEIFAIGEVSGQQALVPGRDFGKFKDFLTPTIKFAWKCEEQNNRLIFQDLGDAAHPVVNPAHPEWESISVKLGRKLGYVPPESKVNGKPNPEKFNWGFLHVGVEITAEVVKIPSKDPKYRDTDTIDIDTIQLVSADGRANPQTKITTDDIDADMKVLIMENAEGAKNQSEVFKKVIDALKEKKVAYNSKQKSELLSAIDKMKNAKEILA